MGDNQRHKQEGGDGNQEVDGVTRDEGERFLRWRWGRPDEGRLMGRRWLARHSLQANGAPTVAPVLLEKLVGLSRTAPAEIRKDEFAAEAALPDKSLALVPHKGATTEIAAGVGGGHAPSPGAPAPG
jgi:hypothetical protein